MFVKRGRRQLWLSMTTLRRVVVLFAAVLMLSQLPSRHVRENSKKRFTHIPACDEPKVYIAVLTMRRPRSLARLLHSLKRVKFACKPVDLAIYIDKVPNEAHCAKTVTLAKRFSWSRGDKSVILQENSVGLSGNWFSVRPRKVYDYLMILEDDLEVSSSFYTLLSFLHSRTQFSFPSLSGFCMYPSDWEVPVNLNCSARSTVADSLVFYESPEPCNWAPLWRQASWYEFLTWVDTLKSLEALPYVPEAIGYNYNVYLDKGFDVQSPWVWRFHWEVNKRFLRHSFTKCGIGGVEKYFAINHKEPGVHYKKRGKIKSRLLTASEFSKKYTNELHVYPFPGYAPFGVSLIPKP